MNERIQKIITSKFACDCDKFCNSVWYVIAIGIVCIIAHSFCVPVVGAALLVILLVPALLFCKNSFVLVPFLLMCTFVMSEETNPSTGHFNNPFYITVLCLLLVVLVAAFVFNIVYYGKWKKMFKRAYLSVSFAVLTAILMLSGAGAPYWSFTGLGIALAIAVTMFFPYSVLVNCGEYNGRKTVEYFAYALIVAAAAIAMGYLKLYIMHGFNSDLADVKWYLQLGYVGPNTGAAIITLAIPMTFYLVYTQKRGYLWLIAVALELFVILFTYSRASLVVAAPGTVIVSTVLCFKKKTERRGYFIAYGICVAIAVVGCIVFRNTIFNLFRQLLEGDFTGSQRTDLWADGLEGWKSYPIVGLGFSYLLRTEWFYSFHCTPLTYLYCAGALGLAAYLYHRYRTVRMVFSAKLTAERVFVAITVLAMLCNALLDIAMTSATHLLYYGVMLALIECDVRSVKVLEEDPDTVETDEKPNNTQEIIDNNNQSENTILQEGE